eukprot:5691985-Pleurochrysis_carterae.AAC.1
MTKLVLQDHQVKRRDVSHTPSHTHHTGTHAAHHPHANPPTRLRSEVRERSFVPFDSRILRGQPKIFGQSEGFVASVDALLAVYDSPGHFEHKLTAFAIIHAEIVLADNYSEYMDVAFKHSSKI